jgi:sodium transport system permease protein
LLEWLEGHDVKLVDPPPEADQALRDRALDVLLEIDERYGEDWAAGHSAKLTVAFDQSQVRAHEVAGRLEQLLAAYGQQVGALRLVMRGVAPEAAVPLFIGERDVSPAKSTDVVGMMMLPFLLLMGALVAAGMLAVDMTAGERERQSIESLLATAAPREHIMLGKVAAASSYGGLVLLAQAVVLLGMSSLLKSDAYHLDLGAVVPLVLVLAPLVVAAATVLTGLAAFAKTVREAQSAMSLVILVPMGPLFYLIGAQPKPTLATYATPVLGQFQLCIDLLRGDRVPVEHVLVHAAMMVVVLGPLIWFCSRLYRREGLAISA